MVCVYCGSATRVKNSRSQQRINHIWRRRKCLVCLSMFTSSERPELDSTFMVEGSKGKLSPFSRDKLFISIYESCRHRPSPTDDARYVTEVIIGQILPNKSDGVITRRAIVKTAAKALGRLDSTAAVIYAAYHPTD